MKKKKRISVAVVLLAAGRGKRMGGDFKQFIRLAGKPALFYSLERFVANKKIQEIIVVLPSEKFEFGQKLVAQNFPPKKVSCIHGGATRALSAYKALKHIQAAGNPPDYVIFHDAARPLVSRSMVLDVIKAAMRYGGAIVGIPSPDLVLKTKSGFIKETCAKKETFCGYTPQCFAFKEIFRAYARAVKKGGLTAQDNIDFLLKMDVNSKIKVIKALFPLPKLTYPSDVFSIQELLKKYHEA